MTMHKALNPKDVIGRLWVKKKRGRELACNEDSVDAFIGGLDNNIKKAKKKNHNGH